MTPITSNITENIIINRNSFADGSPKRKVPTRNSRNQTDTEMFF